MKRTGLRRLLWLIIGSRLWRSSESWPTASASPQTTGRPTPPSVRFAATTPTRSARGRPVRAAGGGPVRLRPGLALRGADLRSRRRPSSSIDRPPGRRQTARALRHTRQGSSDRRGIHGGEAAAARALTAFPGLGRRSAPGTFPSRPNILNGSAAHCCGRPDWCPSGGGFPWPASRHSCSRPMPWPWRRRDHRRGDGQRRHLAGQRHHHAAHRRAPRGVDFSSLVIKLKDATVDAAGKPVPRSTSATARSSTWSSPSSSSPLSCTSSPR